MSGAMKQEIILELHGEGLQMILYGRRDSSGGWKFWTYLNEGTLRDMLPEEDQDMPFESQSDQAQSWDDALKLLDKYPWRDLVPQAVHPDFRERIWKAFRKRRSKDRHETGYFDRERWKELCRPVDGKESGDAGQESDARP